MSKSSRSLTLFIVLISPSTIPRFILPSLKNIASNKNSIYRSSSSRQQQTSTSVSNLRSYYSIGSRRINIIISWKLGINRSTSRTSKISYTRSILTTTTLISPKSKTSFTSWNSSKSTSISQNTCRRSNSSIGSWKILWKNS